MQFNKYTHTHTHTQKPNKWRTIKSVVHKIPGLFTVHFFCSVQMVMVSRNPRVQMVHGYGFHIIAVENELFRRNSVCRGLVHGSCMVKSAVWLRSGLRFQVKSAGWFRSGLHSTHLSFRSAGISHTFNFRHVFTASYQIFYTLTSIPRLPSSRLLCRLLILDALSASFF